MQRNFVQSLFEWTTDCAVGVREIDLEHQQLFALAEAMHGAMREGKGKSVLNGTLAALVAYVGEHFAHEEEVMHRIDYPDLIPHRRQHAALTGRVLALQNRLAAGEITMTIETLRFMMEWIECHIVGSDRQIGIYVESRGTPRRTAFFPSSKGR